MGGHGSGRRANAPLTTDAALALDVRALSRRGGLTCGLHTHTWHSIWGNAVISYVADGSGLVLQYRTRPTWWSEWQDVREVVPIERTPCNYGGDRPWFACPACHQRVAVIYLLEGAFRCRSCHGLAYASTREDRIRRVLRKANRLRVNLGGEPALGLIPPRPTWLGERAYWTTVQRIRDLDTTYIAGAFAQEGDIDTLRSQLRGKRN